jgi:hypothetical protein
MNDIPGAGDQVLRALNYLGDFAERAAPAWAGRLTIRAGYDITLTLRSVWVHVSFVGDDLAALLGSGSESRGLSDGCREPGRGGCAGWP